METTRQQKIAKQIQKDVAEIFQKEGAGIVRGALVTVTAVRISPDFGYAKVYVSIFPFDRSAATMKEIEHQNWFIRRAPYRAARLRSAQVLHVSRRSRSKGLL